MSTRVDYIIVGSGLAGMVMAHTLYRNDRSFCIISDPSLSGCSRVAGGLFNPIVFYRITKSYMADALLPFASEFYTTCEKDFAKKIFHEMPIARIFSSVAEAALWEKRKEEGPGYYLGETIKSLDGIYAPYKMGLIKGSGFLETQTFLDESIKKYEQYFKREKFDFEKIIFGGEHLSYGNINAKGIIFCEGYLAQHNPFFSIPFKPVKGEIITLEFDEDFPDPFCNMILNKKCYLLPLGNRKYKAGATYDWDQLDETITEKARLSLIENIKEITSIPFQVLDQQAGIRPAIKDRRPVIGTHPQHKSLSVFNGLGTKGVMLAPYFADVLLQHLENKKPVPEETGYMRFL
jgi:glycine oxidase